MTLEEYMRELILMDKQYGQEEELYPLINMLLRENDNVKHLSVRDVHNHAGSGVTHEMIYGYSSFPDLVILDEKCDLNSMVSLEKKAIEEQAEIMYGCVEVKNYKEDLSFCGQGDNIEIVRRNIAKCTYKSRNSFPRPEQCFFRVIEDNTDNIPERYFNKTVNIENDYNIEKKSVWVNETDGNPYTFESISSKRKKGERVALKIYKNVFCGMNKSLLCAYPSEQMIGELLWNGKVLYTNGIVWKYLELVKPDKKTISKKLSGCVGKKGAEWTGEFVDKKDKQANQGDQCNQDKITTITVMCVEIGNLSDAYKVLVEKAKGDKLDKLKKKFYLRYNETYGWEQEWDRLKYNLACINWQSENTYNQFITEEDIAKNENS